MGPQPLLNRILKTRKSPAEFPAAPLGSTHTFVIIILIILR